MSTDYFSEEYSGLQEAYLESFRDSLADPYQRNLSTDQIASVFRNTMESLPPMERQAFVDTSLRNTSEFWPALIPIITALAPMVVDRFKPKPKPPAGKPPAGKPQTVQSPMPSSDPTAGQIAAILSNPQFLQALKQGLGISDSGNAPAKPANVNAGDKEAYYFDADGSYADDSSEVSWGPLGILNPLAPGRNLGHPFAPSPIGIATGIGQLFNKPKPPKGKAPISTSPQRDPRYWYFDQRLRQWRRRPTNIPQRDPRYWYFDQRFRQWRRRPAYFPPTAPAPTGQPSNPGYPYPAPTGQPFEPGYPDPALTGQPFEPGYPPEDPAWAGQPLEPNYPPEDPAWAGQPSEVQTPEPTPNTAASQLMALINNPQFLQAIVGQVLGNVGSGNATVQQGNELVNIPFGALMNALTELGQQAAEESVRTGGEESERYLKDNEGNYKVSDPSNPEERADAVMEMLREDYEWRNRHAADPQEAVEAHKSYDPVTDWLISAGMVR